MSDSATQGEMTDAGRRLSAFVAPASLVASLLKATQGLLSERNQAGHWTGELSSSALSTATAVTALALIERDRQAKPSSPIPQPSTLNPRLQNGLAWLAQHINPDGGWGDTVLSVSNISTTTLCWAAFGAVHGAEDRHAEVVKKAERWLADRVGIDALSLRRSPSTLAQAIIARYGKDRTFSVPILTMSALAGRLGEGREAWRHVIPLPFELAACPHSWFAALQLPVVSYALPALIAIGQVRFAHAPPANPFTRLLRKWTRRRTLKILESIQPTNGGFLEATPLTSFVTMSLAGMGLSDGIVARRGVEFLQRSQRPDGSWPIDTNLATWLTTLSINALNDGPPSGASTPKDSTCESGLKPARRWLLDQQYREEHPYTHAAPGAWAWTDLPGGVPDADDTAGALLALGNLGSINDEARDAARRGLHWLGNLQNRDGGIPTFCRGWGALPFDRSSADITAHAIRAWLAWMDEVSPAQRNGLIRSMAKAAAYLSGAQRADGSWVPLWFGNQHGPNDENPTYGTARVVKAWAELHAKRKEHSDLGNATPPVEGPLRRGLEWLVRAQQENGAWGGFPQGPASIEETALAVEALAEIFASVPEWAEAGEFSEAFQALGKGARWLVERVESDAWVQPSPIGFYFANLWYFERLYPMIFTVGALRAASRVMEGHTTSTGHLGKASRNSFP